MSDVNYLSFGGNGTRQIIRKYLDQDPEEIFPDDGLVGQMREIVIPILRVPQGRTISDLLKATHIRDAKFIIGKLVGTGSEEDAGDVLACHNLEFLIGDLWAAKKYCFTTKGGSTGIRYFVEKQHDHGSEVDWDFGNTVNANLPQGRTTGCSMNVTTVDSSAVTGRLLHAHKPTIENPTQAYDWDHRAKRYYGTLGSFFRDLLALFQKLFSRGAAAMAVLLSLGCASPDARLAIENADLKEQVDTLRGEITGLQLENEELAQEARDLGTAFEKEKGRRQF